VLHWIGIEISVHSDMALWAYEL